MSPSSRTPLLDPRMCESTPIRDPQPNEGGSSNPSDGGGPHDFESRSRRQLSFIDAFAIVLGLQIGSGLFISPSLIVQDVHSESVAIVIWFLAGLIAWTCAACFIELGIRVPVNGGPQEYLRACYGDIPGFIASYACIFAIKPCSTAILAKVVSEYLCNAFKIGAETKWREWLAVMVIMLVGLINCTGNRTSNRVIKLLVICKVLGVGFVLVTGAAALFGLQDVSSKNQTSLPLTRMTGKDTAAMLNRTAQYSGIPEATLAAMWVYSGWETLSYVAGDLENPTRNIARVINISMLTVIVITLLMNLAYFSALPFDQILTSTTIGLTYSEHFLGDAGSIVYACIICLSTLGSLNIKVFTAGRLTEAAAVHGYVLPCLQTITRSHPRRQLEEATHDALSKEHGVPFWRRPLVLENELAPVSAIAFNTAIAVLYVFIGGISWLVTFMGCAEYSVILFAICGLVTLRRRCSQVEDRTDQSILFRVPWYLIAVAIVTMTLIVAASIFKHPVAAVALVLTCAVGAVLYHRSRIVALAQESR